jgi:hypothetical protein
VGLRSYGNQVEAGPPGRLNTPSQGGHFEIINLRSGQAALTVGTQRQQMPAQGSVAGNDSLGLSQQALGPGKTQVNASLQEQRSAPPLGAAPLRQRQVQLDVQRPLAAQLDAQLCARWSWRNLGDPALEGRERAPSAELRARW